ncbi:hypothetical protein ACFXPY_42915, partial [Streptomyces sp. NPDC059153]
LTLTHILCFSLSAAVPGGAAPPRAGRGRRPPPPPGTLSELVARYDRYTGSGEINSTVADQPGRTAAVRESFAPRDGVTTDDLDGLTVTGPDWWFNLRASNTEPLLRLNVEARDEQTMTAVRDEVLTLVRARAS